MWWVCTLVLIVSLSNISNMSKLGRIEKVDLREAWRHEARDFTNWLASEDNLAILGEELGLEISLVETEATVGRFNVDILAEEVNSEKKVIIENQLEATDHDHLGKIITYASGLDASIIVWITKDVREEHRQAVDWLNEHTGEEVSFFLLRIEVWRIGDSLPAPKFDIISKPNDWTKAVRQLTRDELTDTKAKQLLFWEQFQDFLSERGSAVTTRTPRAQHWLNAGLGSSSAHISFTLNSFDGTIRTELYIPQDKDLFFYLHQLRGVIEDELGYELEWQELPEKKASRIRIEVAGSVEDEDQWSYYFSWLKERGEEFKEVFGEYIKKR